MAGGAPIGNKNGSKNKPWRDAIAWALKHHEKSQTDRAQALRDIATEMIDKALGGDMAAMKELGDRLDGKAPQDVNIDTTLDLTGMPVSDLMNLFEQIRDAADTPKD